MVGQLDSELWTHSYIRDDKLNMKAVRCSYQDDEEDGPNPSVENVSSLKCTSDAKKMARILQNLFTTADVARKG